MHEKRVDEKREPVYSPTFKAQVALSALQANRSLPELAWEFGVTHEEIARWQAQLLKHAARVFEADETPARTHRKQLLRELKILDDFQASC
ncbi:MAG: hypothetical protein LAT61_13840 [Alcanivorax sp.]|nr:hypothetical protein [Alcanivorax sp.]